MAHKVCQAVFKNKQMKKNDDVLIFIVRENSKLMYLTLFRVPLRMCTKPFSGKTLKVPASGHM